MLAYSVGRPQVKNLFCNVESRTKIVEINFNAEKDYQVRFSRYHIVLSSH